MYNYRFLDCEAPVGAFFKDNALFGTFSEYCVSIQGDDTIGEHYR